MYTILTLNKISDAGLSNLPADFNISDKTETPDGVILRSFSMHDMELPQSLLAVARAGAGVNNIPIDQCTEKGIVVFNTPGANANAVKELVIAGLLLSSRNVVGGIEWAKGLEGQADVAKLVEKGKGEFVGPELMGKKLGVIGLGAIGVLVANACSALGMEVYGYDPFVSVDAAWGIYSSVKKAVSLDEIYSQCDYITVHVPMNKDTKGMIHADAIAKMKDGVRILNFARAELVDDEAVKAALATGKVSFYVTDFPTENVLGVKNVIPVPHLGASSPESEENCAAMAAVELREYLLFGNIRNSVNFPNCELPPADKKRITVIHQNIPSVLSALTSTLASKHINIDNMINKSKGDLAYTIIDADKGDLADAESELLNVNGVMRVRVIQ